jgi:hypothetical protein
MKSYEEGNNVFVWWPETGVVHEPAVDDNPGPWRDLCFGYLFPVDIGIYPRHEAARGEALNVVTEVVAKRSD